MRRRRSAAASAISWISHSADRVTSRRSFDLQFRRLVPEPARRCFAAHRANRGEGHFL